ncbi:hypothetical protein QFC21_006058 [Naganishia friedmannii]|uniref:Uncharacterized protein n=1 Tax=Naganishia friedmannii TaxID=89922 RepID=A0ACC2V6N8_9TREE|nr:hypothetical protein QFC21_006058 [Naganishia friedmannii]
MSNKTANYLVDSVFGTSKLQIESLFNVKGKLALVTGGGTGLGLLTATALAQNGCRVYITGRRLEVLDAAVKKIKDSCAAVPGLEADDGKGPIVMAIQADVGDKPGIEKLKAEFMKHETHLDVLINNHGSYIPGPNLNDVPQTAEDIAGLMYDKGEMSEWMQMYQTNVASYYFTSFAFLPLLNAAATAPASPFDIHPAPRSPFQTNSLTPSTSGVSGSIINIASISSLTPTTQNSSFAYNTSKAATLALSKHLACEFARRNLKIRVNSVLPGYFPSETNPCHPDQGEEYARKQLGIPFARVGGAEDYVQAVLGVMVVRDLFPVHLTMRDC